MRMVFPSSTDNNIKAGRVRVCSLVFLESTMGLFWLVHGLIVLCLPAGALGAVFNLSDLQWTLKNQNGTIAVPALVPSQAHLDLLNAGIITEPLLGINGEA